MWLFLLNNTDFFSPAKKKVLHIAPEPCFKKRFAHLDNCSYAISDFSSDNPKHHIDLTQSGLQSNSIDIILCNHVLEHIRDDRKAIKELHRILKIGGWAIVNVPVDYNRRETYENLEITSPLERRKHFGQEDHVRVYGKDYPDRLKESGFMVHEIDYYKELDTAVRDRYSLLPDDLIYFCRKVS